MVVCILATCLIVMTFKLSQLGFKVINLLDDQETSHLWWCGFLAANSVIHQHTDLYNEGYFIGIRFS